MGSIVSFWRRIRDQKIFWRWFLTFLVSGLGLCFLILAASYRCNVSWQEQENWDRYSASLSHLTDQVDGELLQLHQSMSQLARINSITSHVFKSHYDQNCASNVELDLAAFSDNAPLIQKIFVYFKQTDYIITSSYVATTRQSSAYSALVNEFSDGRISCYPFTDTNGGKTSKLFLYDGELYMSLNFPLSDETALGTIFCQINKNSLFSSAQRTIAEHSRLLIYDACCNPVFASQLMYPSNIASLLPEFLDNGVTQTTVDGLNIAFASSDSFGWMYVYVIDAPAVYISFWKSMTRMGTALLGLFVCCIFLAGALALEICKPLHQLYRLVEPPTADMCSGSVEIPWLLDRIQAQKNELDDLRQCVAELSSDVFIRICRELFDGQQKTASEVSVILNNTDLPFQIHGLYQVCVFYVPGSQVANVRDSGAIPMLKEFCAHTNLLTQIIFTDTHTIALVLSCAEKESILHIKKATAELKQRSAACDVGNGATVGFAFGRVYHSLLDVGFSYQEALEHLRQNPIDTAVPTTSHQEPSTPEGRPRFLEDYDQRTHYIISMLQKDDADNAEKLTMRLIRTIWEENLTQEEVTYNAQGLLSAFAENISQLSNVSFSAFSTDIFVFDPAAKTPMESLQDKCITVLKTLNNVFRKQKMPIILKTQQIVEANYVDANLSLSFVAENIGVNMSYLSHQFKDSLGVTFTDYLNMFRIQKSMELLRSSDQNMTLNAVAVSCGFSSVQNYIRVFKKHVGMTPGQYRSENSPKY